MRKKTFAVAALFAAATLTLSACGTDDSTSPVAVVSQEGKRQAATVLDQPFTKPALVLTDTRGASYDLRKETDGHPTLVYFGYTNCPDVCPLTMSNIAVAKKQLPKAEQDDLRVVFVTTDPDRDTPAALGAWLKGIDPQVVGLTGKFATIQTAARSLGISVEAPHKDKNGKIVSTHGTQVVAFSPKTNGGYLLYGESAKVDDYIKDLPKIIKGENP
ncbi:SCO family protein [Streptomyces sp. NPDC054884]|uniref:SCO family protein n=1 Tax=Streptomyces sp. ME08-AFT2 TaxID=3028683 RepID=UPI0029A6A03D|nr:SCO family protein [Streptomyces sp. ME08-AFT2]MDX3309002.1 SCO family protein [Streptomyces sp. ME08-AFT2]